MRGSIGNPLGMIRRIGTPKVWYIGKIWYIVYGTWYITYAGRFWLAGSWVSRKSGQVKPREYQQFSSHGPGLLICFGQCKYVLFRARYECTYGRCKKSMAHLYMQNTFVMRSNAKSLQNGPCFQTLPALTLDHVHVQRLALWWRHVELHRVCRIRGPPSAWAPLALPVYFKWLFLQNGAPFVGVLVRRALQFGVPFKASYVLEPAASKSS